MFYRLENNTIKRAPSPLLVDGKHIFTTDETIYNAQGYYRLQTADYPDDNNSYEPQYTLEGNVIVQNWIKTKTEE